MTGTVTYYYLKNYTACQANKRPFRGSIDEIKHAAACTPALPGFLMMRSSLHGGADREGSGRSRKTWGAGAALFPPYEADRRLHVKGAGKRVTHAAGCAGGCSRRGTARFHSSASSDFESRVRKAALTASISPGGASARRTRYAARDGSMSSRERCLTVIS